MLARKTSSKNGKSMPQDWLEGLSRLLNETYSSDCKKQDRYFDVYGQIFPEELLVVVSWLSEKDEYQSPITLFLSSEAGQISDESKVKKTQGDYIDVVGLFFDEIFASEEWDGFEPNWQEVTYKSETYFFKLTRENISLTLDANKLLGPEFDDLEEDEIEH